MESQWPSLMPRRVQAALCVEQSRFHGRDLKHKKKETADTTLRLSRTFRVRGPEPILTLSVAHVILTGRS